MHAAEYRTKAEELEKLADRAATPELREEYLKLAAGWRAVAKMAERAEKAPGG